MKDERGSALAPAAVQRVLPAAGLALIAFVVAWRLADASYLDDVETICDAEASSGLTLARDMPALTEWVRARLATPRGNALYASLRDLPVGERGERLRAAASRTATRCRLAGSYDQLEDDARYRADVEHLCSRVDLPELGLEEVDEAMRVQVLVEWIETHAESAHTAGLGEALREADGPADRAGVLSAAARGLGLLGCDNAKVLARGGER